MPGAIGRRYKFVWQGCTNVTAGVVVFIAEIALTVLSMWS